MSHLFQGKVIAITGAASGIGLATAKILSARGAVLAISDIAEVALQEAAETIRSAGGLVTTTVVDVRDRTQVEAWITDIVSTHGKIDCAANIAGVLPQQAMVAGIENVDDEDWNRVLSINIGGTLNCLRAELKVMKEGSSIVNAASVGAVRAMAKNGAYVTSKHAIVGMTKAASAEVAERGVRVNAIAPGPIETPMLKRHNAEWPMIPMKRAGRAVEVAELIAWLLCDASLYITGTVNVIDGGWAA